MNEHDETRLRDILDAARDALAFKSDRSSDLLGSDKMFSYALVRALEIIGEAASQITQKTRNELPQIPWKSIVGMRNKIIHEYRSVDYEVVWETVTLRLPELIAELEKILPPESAE